MEDLEITIQGDDEGYITFECPFCKSEFKLRADECQNDETPYDEYFCPYCGLVKDKNEFLSEDIIEQVKAIAMNELIEEDERKEWGYCIYQMKEGKMTLENQEIL